MQNRPFAAPTPSVVAQTHAGPLWRVTINPAMLYAPRSESETETHWEG